MTPAAAPSHRAPGFLPGVAMPSLVRLLARSYRRKMLPATTADREERREEEGYTLRAQGWTGLVLPEATAGAPRFWVVAVHEPRYWEPLLLATALDLTPQEVRAVYRDRWPVEQAPLSAKQMVGAARQYVHEAETCQRLPELALLAGAVLSYAAAMGPLAAAGYWDRRPQGTPGRLRRVLEYRDFPVGMALPEQVREQAAVTEHLPKGHWGQQHPRRATTAAAAGSGPTTSLEATIGVSGNERFMWCSARPCTRRLTRS